MEILNNYPIYEEKGSPEFIQLVDSLLNGEEPTYENRFAVIILAASKVFPPCHMEADYLWCISIVAAYLVGTDKLFNDRPKCDLVCPCQAKKLLNERTQNTILSDHPTKEVETLLNISKARVKWWHTVCVPAWEVARNSKEKGQE